jgi:hypothetical protein
MDNMINEQALYVAPDHAFISAVSGMVKNFPWERFERFFEARPLVKATAIDQVFMLRVLAIQELLCVDDESVLAWLKSQMYLSAFLSPEFKPKVPTKALLDDFRNELRDANLLEPFRQRCQNIILQKQGKTSGSVEPSSYLEAFAPKIEDFPEISIEQGKASGSEGRTSRRESEDKWVTCPKCERSALNQVESQQGDVLPRASCDHCGHHFKV